MTKSKTKTKTPPVKKAISPPLKNVSKGKKKTVLFIDGRDDIAHEIKNIFEEKDHVQKEEKFNFLFAENAKEALEYLQKTKVDVIVMEIILPVISGYHLLRILEKKKIPIIIYTHLKHAEDLDRMSGYKVDNIVIKELTKMEQLMEIIDKNQKIKITDILKNLKSDLDGNREQEHHSKFKMLQCQRCRLILLPESHFCNNCGEKIIKEAPKALMEKSIEAGKDTNQNNGKKETVEKKEEKGKGEAKEDDGKQKIKKKLKANKK